MQCTVANVGRFSRLSLHGGTRWFYPALAFGLAFASMDCLALPSGSFTGAPEMGLATLNAAILPVDWKDHWLRLIIEIDLVVVIGALVWFAIYDHRRNARQKLQERERTDNALTAEHASRVMAESESRTLSQRLITAHEDERKYLARELHDDLTQRLARLAIDAAQAERGVPTAPDHNTWRKMREELARLSEDVHSLAYRLHPSVLDDLGLVAAIQAECDRFSRRESIPVRIKSNDVPEQIPREVALCLFRIGQESLNNVARHARARAVEVSLAGLDHGLQLCVHDDGIGFNTAQTVEHATLGLASMRERARLLNGELKIESEPGRGTTIAARVPLKEASKP